jgi:cytidylate kinase
MATLISRTMTKHGVNADDARKLITETNSRRANYVKRYWHRDWRDVANYHLCVNTAWLGIDGAAEMITRAARRLA